jgi:hypothetical protein
MPRNKNISPPHGIDPYFGPTVRELENMQRLEADKAALGLVAVGLAVSAGIGLAARWAAENPELMQQMMDKLTK